jgi:hypothetical protein
MAEKQSPVKLHQDVRYYHKVKLKYSKDVKEDVRQCLTPVIPATQEAEIRRITVQRQPGQIVHETLSQKHPSQKRNGLR